jgi:hypothetical protein
MGYNVYDVFDEVIDKFERRMEDWEKKNQEIEESGVGYPESKLDLFLRIVRERSDLPFTNRMREFVIKVLKSLEHEEDFLLSVRELLLQDGLGQENDTCFILRKNNGIVEMVGELPEGFSLTYEERN